MLSYLLPFILALFIQSSIQIGFIRPLTPFEATFVNTKLPSIYNFHFSLTSGLRSDAYIRVKFPNYTTLTTSTCLFGVNQTKATSSVSCNIVGDSVYIAPKIALNSQDEIRASIFLSDPVPDTPGYTKLFEVSTVSSTDPSTAIIFDANPGYGNFVWGANSLVGQLFLEGLDFGTPTTKNLQGAANDVKVHVRFNRGFTAKLSRIIVVVDMPWKFGNTNIILAKSSLYDVALALGESTDLYTAPVISNLTLINDQVLEIYFNETFPEGREFLMTVTNITNPLAISNGKLRFYTTDYTSNYVLEANENTVIFTAKKTLAITVGLAAGIPLGGPAKLYKNTEQYIKISFPIDATTISAGSTILYEFSTDNTPIPGTLYLDPSLTPKDGTKIQYTYAASSITLTNLGPLTVGTNITMQTKMKFSKFQPKLMVTISILLNGVVVKYGESTPLPLATNGASALVSVMGLSSEANVVDINPSSSIKFTFYADSRTSAANSAITIYSNKYISTSALGCAHGGGQTFSQCAFTSGAYGTFSLKGLTGQNLLTINTNVLITLSNLVISKPSSHEEAIYEFYIRIDKDGTGTTVLDLMTSVYVRPQRNQLTNLNQFHSMDVASNNLVNFPSFIRIFGTSTALSALTPSATDKVVITMYGYVTLADFIQVSNEGSFPCGSSLSSITCVYIKGNPNTVSSNPLDWDRVIITLPSTATSTAFNIYLPQFFKNSGTQNYEFTVGLYNTGTRIYQNLYLEPQYAPSVSRSTSFTVTASGLVSNNANLYIDLRGQRAGVLVPSPIALSIDTQTGYNPNSGSNYGASAILITEWELWNTNSIVTAVSTPLSSAAQDATVFLRYTTTTGDTMNAVIWPMIGTANPQKLFMIDKVEMPYSLDIPNYVMYLTDNTGQLTHYNSLINSGKNTLSTSAITEFTFSCKHMIQGYLNTYCTMTFKPNAKIDRQAKIKIQYDSAFITISQCSLSYLSAPSTTTTVSSSLYSCTSSLREIQLSFNLPDRLPVTTYNFTFYGFDQGTGVSQGLTFSIYDANYGFVVEQAGFTYPLELAIADVISIDSISYDFLNLDAISNFKLRFSLPREIYPNEILEFDIGSDLQSNNKNTDRLAIILENVASGARINIYGALKSQILTIQFGQSISLASGSYTLSIDNLKTPTSHSTDKVKIRLKRSTDNVFVMQSKESSFTSYPVLQLGSSSFIKIVKSRFLCVGCLGEFVFQVTLSNSYIDVNTDIYFHFPSYFLPAITNQPEKLDCRFNYDPVVCETEADYPFRLRLSGSPIYLNPGDTFNITIYGFVVPNLITTSSATEDIFFAIDSFFNGTFSEQSNVALPSLSAIKTGLGSMFFYSLSIARTVVRDKVDHVLRVNITVDIPANSTITVTFTNEYSNIRYLDYLSCQLNIYSNGIKSSDYSSSYCSITGQTVNFFVTKNIYKAFSLELNIQSVPTPPQEVTIDPNQFIIAAFGVDENDVLAMSKESLNSIYQVTFLDANNTIEAQNNQDIVLTRGTYTDNIAINTNGNKRVIQDVSINAVAQGFTFVPSVIDFFVGDISHTFKVGCDLNVKLRTYPFNFTQTQDEALVNAYGDLFNLRVTVVETPIVINIPTTVIVPVGGSSLPYAISLSQKPYKELQILIDIDEEYYDGAFGVDLDYSSPSLNFTSTSGLAYISFFSTSAISSFPSTFNVNLKLDGANYKSYSLNQSQIQIQIQSVPFGGSTVSGNLVSTGKTQATFQITPTSEGMLIVQLSQDCIAKQNLTFIKNMLRNNSFSSYDITTGCPQTYFTRVMSTPGSPYSLNLPGLVPETKYNLFIYFENKAKQSNSDSPLTFSFTTQPLDATFKMTGKFSRTIFVDQLNKVICFLLRLFETRIVNVVDAQGLSCSSYIEPTNRFLKYQGASFANFAQTFSFYLLPDPTLEFDASSLSVPVYFNSTTNLANPAFYTAATKEGIDFIQEFKLEYSFTYNQAKTSTGSVAMPTLQSYTSDTITAEGNSTIRMTNFKMSSRGSVYAIAREIAKVTVDPEDEFTTTDVTTRIPRTPSTDQISGCQDWNGDTADACAKAVIANDDNVELLLRNLKTNTMYVVYYTVANEYPIETFLANNIQSFTVRILNDAGKLIVGWMLLLGCIFSLFM